nr:uncharacterized protein LOC105475904 [Macaca nemestrina]
MTVRELVDWVVHTNSGDFATLKNLPSKCNLSTNLIIYHNLKPLAKRLPVSPWLPATPGQATTQLGWKAARPGAAHKGRIEQRSPRRAAVRVPRRRATHYTPPKTGSRRPALQRHAGRLEEQAASENDSRDSPTPRPSSATCWRPASSGFGTVLEAKTPQVALRPLRFLSNALCPALEVVPTHFCAFLTNQGDYIPKSETSVCSNLAPCRSSFSSFSQDLGFLSFWPPEAGTGYCRILKNPLQASQGKWLVELMQSKLQRQICGQQSELYAPFPFEGDRVLLLITSQGNNSSY